MVLGASGTRRDLPNLDSHTVSTPLSGSTSSAFRRSTSPTRIPVAHSSPMIVSTVAAHSGGRNARAASISAAMSASEYRCGTGRVRRTGSRPVGGTSWVGSRACR